MAQPMIATHPAQMGHRQSSRQKLRRLQYRSIHGARYHLVKAHQFHYLNTLRLDMWVPMIAIQVVGLKHRGHHQRQRVQLLHHGSRARGR